MKQWKLKYQPIVDFKRAECSDTVVWQWQSSIHSRVPGVFPRASLGFGFGNLLNQKAHYFRSEYRLPDRIFYTTSDENNPTNLAACLRVFRADPRNPPSHRVRCPNFYDCGPLARALVSGTAQPSSLLHREHLHIFYYETSS